MEPWAILLLVAAGLFALWLAFTLFCAAISGAILLFGLAAVQGFIGIAAYIACWVFFFPVMLVISIIIGIFAWLSGRLDNDKISN